MGKDYALTKGMPAEDIILADWTTSTYEDAVAVRSILPQQGYSPAIIVSDPFHMRRAMWIMNKEVPGVRLIAAPAESGWLDPYTWWTRENDLLAVVQEYCKFALYIAKYGP